MKPMISAGLSTKLAPMIDVASSSPVTIGVLRAKLSE